MLRIAAIVCYVLVSVSSLPLASAASQATAGGAAATNSLAATVTPSSAGAKLAPAKKTTTRRTLKPGKKLRRKVSKAKQRGKAHATPLGTKAPASPLTSSKIAKDGTATS